MKSVKLYLALLLMGMSLAVARPCSAQTLFNNDTTILVANTCLNGTLFTGNYTMTLYYVDPDSGDRHPAPVSVSVVANSTTAIIKVPLSFGLPTPSANGYWSLADADKGSILLTGGSGGGLMAWSHDANGNLVVDCFALPVTWGTRLAFQSGTKVEILQVTALESGTSFLEFYRSTAGINGFYKIGQLPAAGNAPTGHFYTFIDSFPANGVNRYYLKMLTPGAPSDISDTFSVSCSGCSFTPPAPVVCNDSIIGPNHICDPGVLTAYNLSDTIPNYNSIAWSIDQPAAAHLASNPAYDLGHATLLRKDTDAVVVLKATLSGCSNPITKYISIGSPKVTTIHDSLACGNFPNFYAWVDSIPGATNYKWTIVDSTAHVLTFTNGTRNTFDAFLVTGDIYYLSVIATNACGTGQETVLHSIVCSGGGGFLRNSVVASPNPTPGQVAISLVAAPVPRANEMAVANAAGVAPNAKAIESKVYQIRVLDKMGNLKKTFVYPGGLTNVSIDLSSLPADIYTVQVFDNVTWTARQIILAK